MVGMVGRRLAAGAKVSYHMGKESRTSICTVEIRVSSSRERGLRGYQASVRFPITRRVWKLSVTWVKKGGL